MTQQYDCTVKSSKTERGCYNTYCLPRSYPLFAGVVVGVSDIVLVVVVVGGGGGCHGGGDSRGMFGTHVVVSASLGAVGFSTVLAQKHRLLIIRELSSTALLVVLVAHQTGEVS